MSNKLDKSQKWAISLCAFAAVSVCGLSYYEAGRVSCQNELKELEAFTRVCHAQERSVPTDSTFYKAAFQKIAGAVSDEVHWRLQLSRGDISSVHFNQLCDDVVKAAGKYSHVDIGFGEIVANDLKALAPSFMKNGQELKDFLNIYKQQKRGPFVKEGITDEKTISNTVVLYRNEMQKEKQNKLSVTNTGISQTLRVLFGAAGKQKGI